MFQYRTSQFQTKQSQFLRFTGRSASSWGQVKEHAWKALYSVISLLMRLPFCPVRTLPYATLHKLPRIWCKSGVVVGVVRLRWKCPVYRSIFQRNGSWLPWWLLPAVILCPADDYSRAFVWHGEVCFSFVVHEW